MRIRLFSKDSNPKTDPPLLHKSKSYVDSLVSVGDAFYLSARDAQLVKWRRRETADRESMQSALNDWFISDLSFYPDSTDSRIALSLRITTRQLSTT